MTDARTPGAAYAGLPSGFESMVSEQQRRLDEVREQERYDRTRRARWQRFSRGVLFIGFALALVAVWCALVLDDAALWLTAFLSLLALFLVVGGTYGLVLQWVNGEPLSWHEKNREQRRLQELRDLKLPVPARAERQLTDHRNELDEYYRQARSQSNSILVVGIAILLLSLVLVGVLLYVVITQEPLDESQQTASLIALVSIIVTDVIAGIYLWMFRDAQKNLNDFHQRLAYADSLYIAAMVVARIPDPQQRSAAATVVAAQASRGEHRRMDESQTPSRSTEDQSEARETGT